MSDNRPISEQYRRAADTWVALDSAATMLEECKTAVLAQRQAAQGDIPVAHAERIVKSSPEWMDYIKKMVKAREQANLARVEMEFLRMRAWEEQSENANKRAEMRL